jgi:hypothetical protein
MQDSVITSGNLWILLLNCGELNSKHWWSKHTSIFGSAFVKAGVTGELLPGRLSAESLDMISELLLFVWEVSSVCWPITVLIQARGVGAVLPVGDEEVWKGSRHNLPGILSGSSAT